MAERQTRGSQKPLSERECGFKSHPGHKMHQEDLGHVDWQAVRVTSRTDHGLGPVGDLDKYIASIRVFQPKGKSFPRLVFAIHILSRAFVFTTAIKLGRSRVWSNEPGVPHVLAKELSVMWQEAEMVVACRKESSC